MKRVLVTGASGFIGRQALAPLVARGYQVVAVARQPLVSERDNVAWQSADLFVGAEVRDLLQRVQPTHLLHFAWCAKPGVYWTSEDNFRWVQSSLELLRAFVQHGGKRVVVAGTCAEYDWSSSLYSETTTPLQPATVYGVCKNALRQLLLAYAENAGLRAAWGRLFFLYGPHEHPARVVPSVVTALLKREPACCSHGRQIRDFLHVQDAAEAFVALLESDVGGAVNIASGQATTIREVVTEIATHIGRLDLLQLGALPAAPNEPPELVADVTRLREEVGWQPKWSLPDGLAATIEWWAEYLHSERGQLATNN